MMKKLISGIAALMTALSAVSAFAQAPSVYLNGEKMTFDVDPYISEERTMVPFRAIFEAAEADVMWDGDTSTVVAVKDNGMDSTSVVLQIGESYAFVDDAKIELDKPAEIKEERTFVPLRFVMESLGAEVEWDGDSYSVMIKTK